MRPLLLKLISLLLILSACTSTQKQQNTSSVQQTAFIVINQAGYRPDWPKQALLINAVVEKGNVNVINKDSGKTVSVVQLGSAKFDKLSGDHIQFINFSSITQPGKYQLQYGGIESYEFRIDDNVYQPLMQSLLRSFYLQRCGEALQDTLTNLEHPICHTKDGVVSHVDAFHEKGEKISAQGGWHDAGDYGKYVATTTVSIAHILSVYEQYPSLFEHSLSIPESENAIPDVLDEMAVGLNWLLRMQRSDGAIYRKLSGNQWPKVVAPHRDKQTRYIYGISSADTAKFSAVMALASRVYLRYVPTSSQRYLQAALRAWSYLQAHEEQVIHWVKGDDSGSGKYLLSKIDNEDALRHDLDDRLWAATELFITTHEPVYQRYLKPLLYLSPYTIFEWKDPSAMAMRHYYLHENQDMAGRKMIERKILQRAKHILHTVKSNGYGLANIRFVWGSNKMTAEKGITLLYAYNLSQDPKYFNAALEQLDYLLGRNHFNKSFVTGIGQNPVAHVMHLFARAINKTIPGLLVGGPNNMAQSGFAYKNRGPLSYIDHKRSYATNEYAIDYNATLIGLLGTLLGMKGDYDGKH